MQKQGDGWRTREIPPAFEPGVRGRKGGYYDAAGG